MFSSTQPVSLGYLPDHLVSQAARSRRASGRSRRSYSQRSSCGQVQLEAADILGCGRVGGAMEERGKPLAAANVAPPRARRELPRIHVLDHTVTQRGDGIRTHRKTPALDEVDDTSILKTGGPSAYRRSPIPVAGAR